MNSRGHSSESQAIDSSRWILSDPQICRSVGRLPALRTAPVRRLLLLLEQILEDELAPSAAACVHQRATFVELSQLDGCESELFGQGRHGSGRVFVVARQKNDPVAALDDRIGRERCRNQVIEPFDELGAGERLRDEGGRPSSSSRRTPK